LKVVEVLRKVGSKAGLIHYDSEVAQSIEVTVWEKQVISLQQLQDDAEKKQREELSAPPPEISVDFAQVFDALKIPPPAHGWTVETLKQALGDALQKGHQEASSAATALLAQNQVPADDIIKDAVNRDKALDSYEAFVAKKMEERSASRKRIMEDLRQQIKESEAQIERLNLSQASDDRNFQQWQNKKVEKEEELAKVVALLTSQSEISVGKKKS